MWKQRFYLLKGGAVKIAILQYDTQARKKTFIALFFHHCISPLNWLTGRCIFYFFYLLCRPPFSPVVQNDFWVSRISINLSLVHSPLLNVCKQASRKLRKVFLYIIVEIFQGPFSKASSSFSIKKIPGQWIGLCLGSGWETVNTQVRVLPIRSS